MPHSLQSSAWLFPLAFLAAWLAVAAGVGFAFTEPAGENPSRPVVANSAWLAVAAWFAAGGLAAFHPRAARNCYAWGCAVYLLHVALAFHLGHRWSHAAAFDHVERTSGFGRGLFVSYLFTLTWLADAAWSVLAFETYRRRSRWWNGAVHGFMAFVIFNATVVYGEGPGRWLSAAAFAAIIAIVLRRWL